MLVGMSSFSREGLFRRNILVLVCSGRSLTAVRQQSRVPSQLCPPPLLYPVFFFRGPVLLLPYGRYTLTPKRLIRATPKRLIRATAVCKQMCRSTGLVLSRQGLFRRNIMVLV